MPAPVPDLTVRLRDIPLTKVAVTKSTRLNSRYMPARHLQLARKSLFRSALHMHATVLTPLAPHSSLLQMPEIYK